MLIVPHETSHLLKIRDTKKGEVSLHMEKGSGIAAITVRKLPVVPCAYHNDDQGYNKQGAEQLLHSRLCLLCSALRVFLV